MIEDTQRMNLLILCFFSLVLLYSATFHSVAAQPLFHGLQHRCLLKVHLPLTLFTFSSLGSSFSFLVMLLYSCCFIRSQKNMWIFRGNVKDSHSRTFSCLDTIFISTLSKRSTFCDWICLVRNHCLKKTNNWDYFYHYLQPSRSSVIADNLYIFFLAMSDIFPNKILDGSHILSFS